MKKLILTSLAIITVLAFTILVFAAIAQIMTGRDIKKITNKKYTFGDIGEGLGHRLYNEDSTIIHRDDQSVKAAYKNGSIKVTYNGDNVCVTNYQTAKGEIDPLTPVAADLGDWNKPCLRWYNGTATNIKRQPGELGRGQYCFHYDNVSNPNLTKQDGTPWQEGEGKDFIYGTNLSALREDIYNTPDGFTIYEDGEEITSKVYNIGTANGTDGEILQDILDSNGNPTGLLSVKGKIWTKKDGTPWQWSDATGLSNAAIKTGTVISGTEIYGPDAEDGFCLFINGKEITSYVEEIENEEAIMRNGKTTNFNEKIFCTARGNWCDKDGNSILYSNSAQSLTGKPEGFTIRDRSGNDVCAKSVEIDGLEVEDLDESYITIGGERKSPLKPVFYNLNDWENVNVPQGHMYIDPVLGKVKFNGNYSEELDLNFEDLYNSTVRLGYLRIGYSPSVYQPFFPKKSGYLSKVQIKATGQKIISVTLGEYIYHDFEGNLSPCFDSPYIYSCYKSLSSSTIEFNPGGPFVYDVYFENMPYVEAGKTYILQFSIGSHEKSYVHFISFDTYSRIESAYHYSDCYDDSKEKDIWGMKPAWYIMWLKTYIVKDTDIPEGPLNISYNSKPINEIAAMDFDIDKDGEIINSDGSIDIGDTVGASGLIKQAIKRILIDPVRSLIYINKRNLNSPTDTIEIDNIKVNSIQIPDIKEVSVNQNDGSCWVACIDGVRKISPDCTQILGAVVGFNAALISVNQNDGSCWVACTNGIKKIGSECTNIIGKLTGFKVLAISVNQNDGTCWVACTNGIKKIGSECTNIISELEGVEYWSNWNSGYPALSVNRNDGTCWVAAYSVKSIFSGIWLLNSDCTEVLNMLVDSDSFKIDYIFKDFCYPSISVNQNDGTCWISSTHRIIKLNSSPQIVSSLYGNYKNVPLSVNQNDGTCWFACTNISGDFTDYIAKISSDGDRIIAKITGFEGTKSISVNPNDGSIWVSASATADNRHSGIIKINTSDIFPAVSEDAIYTFNYNCRKYSENSVIAKDLSDSRPDWILDTAIAHDEIFIDPVTGRFRFHDQNIPDGRLTVSYNFNADITDPRASVYGELAIDPGCGRVMFHPEDVPLYPTDDTMSGEFYYMDYEGDRPLPPVLLNAVPGTSDTPFNLKGSKQEDTSVWLKKGNYKNEIVEQDEETSWSAEYYLDNGANDLIFTSKIYELESGAGKGKNSYDISYEVKTPTIDNESPMTSDVIKLFGKKGKNTSIELLKHIDGLPAGNGNDDLDYTFSFFSDSLSYGTIVKNSGEQINNKQNALEEAVNDSIKIYINGVNELMPIVSTAESNFVPVLIDLSDETGYGNWIDPNIPDKGQIAIDINSGRFKFNSADAFSDTDYITVKFNYFKEIVPNNGLTIWMNSDIESLISGDNIFTIKSKDNDGSYSDIISKTIFCSAKNVIAADRIEYQYITTGDDGIENDLEINLPENMAYNSKWGSLGTGIDNFNNPHGITFADGYIFIADMDNHRIVKLQASDYSYITDFGSQGTNTGQFESPESVAVDASGNMYVLDSGNSRIQKFIKINETNYQYADQWGSAGSGFDTFNNPKGIVIKDGYVYIADKDNHRVVKLRESDYSHITDFGSQGTNTGQFESPESLTVDNNSNVYVLDTSNCRVQKFTASDGINYSFSSEFGQYGLNRLNNPRGVAYDDDYIYIADRDNHRIVKLNATNYFYVTEFGIKGSGNGQFYFPESVAIKDNEVFVADTGNHRIQRFSRINLTNYEYVDQWGGHGSEYGKFNTPKDIDFDNSGNIYIADYSNYRIQRFKYNSISNEYEFNDAIGYNTSLEYRFRQIIDAVFSGEYLHILELNVPTDKYRIIRFDKNLNYICETIIDKGNEDDQLFNPNSIDVNTNVGGYVYILDAGNNCVKAFSFKSSSYHYEMKFTDDKFNDPIAIAVGDNDDVYIANAGDNMIRKYNGLTGSYIVGWGGYGTGTFNFERIEDITASGNSVFVAEVYNLATPTVTYPRNLYGKNEKEKARIKEFRTSDGINYTYVTRGVTKGVIDAYVIENWAGVLLYHRMSIAKIGGYISVLFQCQDRQHEQGTDELYYAFRKVVQVNRFYMSSLTRFYNKLINRSEYQFPYMYPIFCLPGEGNNTYFCGYKAIYKSIGYNNYKTIVNYFDNSIYYKFQPTGVKVDDSGNVYVSDVMYNRVMIYSSDDNSFGTFITNIEGFNSPIGLDINSEGRLFIMDHNNNLIKKYEKISEKNYSLMNSIPVDAGYGIAIDSDDNIHVSKIQSYNEIVKYDKSTNLLLRKSDMPIDDNDFCYPSDIDIDDEGNLFIVDTGNNRIQKFNNSGDCVASIGSQGNGNGQFNIPGGIKINGDEMFVADTGNSRIQKFNIINNSSGEDTFEYSTKWSNHDVLLNPEDVFIDDSGYVYIIDSGNDKVIKLRTNGSVYELHTEWGSPGTGIDNLDSPYGIVINNKNNVLIMDSGNNRIQIIESESGIEYNSKCEFTKWPASDNYEFISPSSISVDNDGNVFVVDTGNDRILKYDGNGNYITKWGSSGNIEGWFNSPRDINIDGDDVFIVDSSNNRIQKFNRVDDTTYDYVMKFGDLDSGNEQLSTPGSCAVDDSGNIWIIESENNKIKKFNKSNNSKYTLAIEIEEHGTNENQIDTLVDIVFDGSNKMYVTDSANNRLQRIDTVNESLCGNIFNWALSDNYSFHFPINIHAINNIVYVVDTGNNRILKYGIEQIENSLKFNFLMQWGNFCPGCEQLNNPTDLAVNSNGKIFVVDSGNNRIQKFDSDGNHILTWGEYGSNTNQFNNPAGIAIDGSGKIFVVDSGNNRIQEFDSDGNHILTWGEYGSNTNQFNNPTGIAIDSDDNIYVVDTGNSRIIKCDSSGNYLLTWGSFGFKNGQFKNPSYITINNASEILISDTGNNRIQVFDSNGKFICRYGKSGNQNYEFNNSLGISYNNNRLHIIDSGNHRIQVLEKGQYNVRLTYKEIDMNSDEIDNVITNSITYDNVPDSPYLTLHIAKEGNTNITHKHITSRQLTSLVPFVDEFENNDSLRKQGTYSRIPSGSTNWKVNNGQLECTTSTENKLLIPKIYPTWKDYQFTVYIKKLNGTPLNCSLLYKLTDIDNYYEFSLSENGSKINTTNYCVTETTSTPIQNTAAYLEKESIFNTDFTPVKVEVRHHKPSGNTYVKTFINEEQINYFIHNMPVYGGIGIKVVNAEIAIDRLEIRPLK